ncbi:hypothetical protein [Dyadobacter sandarakinus]|uniref:Uncharacterized protein n=1 Tax=Dyadobacter sandarakinus TaxID=2747268 RepID=A0ABX7I1L3_9BACT|nr:hypothetical protein [Dyadobacter sandarakinus]QRQ99744.1 hypothetical protein HWI92_01830 [Dyadobacter sandarakinus]
MKKATQRSKEAKADLLTTAPYDGQISASWQGKTKFSINPKGEKPFELYSSKPIAALRKKYPDAIVNQIKY